MTITRIASAGPISTAISVTGVLRGVLGRKLLIGLFGLCAFAGALGMLQILKPVYSTEAQVLIDNLETPFDRVQTADNKTGNGVDDRVVASQMSVLKSEDLGRRVIAALKLEESPEFNSMLKGIGTLSKLKLALGFGEDPRLKTPEQRALGHYLDELSIYQEPSSNVINIKYSAADPETAAKVANTLADIYVMATRESQSLPTERARDWLAQQIDGLRKKLAASEQAVEEFRSQAGLLQGASTTLNTQQISELNTQITVAQTASAEAKARADAIRQLLASKGSLDNSSEVLASATIQHLKEQRTEAMRNLAQLSATYLPSHPKMIAAQGELANVDRQIRAEALKVLAGLAEQARIAQAREASLRASLEEMKSKESTSNLDDVKLKALEREAAAGRILLETMLSRYAEASARQDASTQPGLARIIQSAAVPASPSFPKPGPMVLLITVAGLSLGFGIAFLAEIMAAAARLTQRLEEDEYEDAAQSPIVVDPRPAPVPPQPVVNVAPSPAVQPVAAMAKAPAPLAPAPAAANASGSDLPEWAAACQRDLGVRRFAVTAISIGAADCCLTAVNLARAMAAAGRRVIVVDLARSGPWLEWHCGGAAGPGIVDLVTGAADFTRVIGRDSKSPAHFLRFGLDRSERSLALLAERLDSVLAALGESYEAVIVNAGEATPETPILLHKCEAAVILAPVGHFADAVAAVQALLSSGLRAARHVLIGQSQPQATPPQEFSLKMANA